MSHIDDDLLMKMALKLLEEGEESVLHEHLSECSDCSVRLNLIRRDIELISSLEPRVERPMIPLPRARGLRTTAWLRVAALFLVGFVIGYGVSLLSEDRVVCIVPSRVYAPQPLQAYPSFTSCESVDLAIEFYSEGKRDSGSR
ncbi:MAG: hypothetical protein KOO63_14300 [Bacteroidales bacterium]|nr:hypothetical protein [Candidatus Latescibacterota bacterium]